MPDAEPITMILDLLDDQLEREVSMAEANPLWFRSWPGQTREQIQFFQSLALDFDDGGTNAAH